MVPRGRRHPGHGHQAGRPARQGRPRHRRRQLTLHRRHRERRSCSRPRESAIVDCGVSGGIWGLHNGYGLMCGGETRLRQPGDADLRRAAPRGPARRGLRPRRQGRRRPLHEDGAQRHRVRPDARPTPRATSCSRRRTSSRTSPAPSRRGAAAPSSGPGCSTSWSRRSRRTPRSTTSPTTPSTPVRGAGPSRRPSPSPCRCRSSRRRCSPGSPRARTSSPTMQIVAALRGQFGGHQVMTLEEGEELRRKARRRPTSAIAATAKAARKERRRVAQGRRSQGRKAPAQDRRPAPAKRRRATGGGPRPAQPRAPARRGSRRQVELIAGARPAPERHRLPQLRPAPSCRSSRA